MVARNDRGTLGHAFRGKDNERIVARSELLVELHLRAKLVVCRNYAAVRQADLQVLSPELDEAVELERSVVYFNDFRAARPRAVVSKPARPRHEREGRANERQDGNRQVLSREQRKSSGEGPTCRSPS